MDLARTPGSDSLVIYNQILLLDEAGARFTRDGEDVELGLEYRGEDDGWAADTLPP